MEENTSHVRKSVRELRASQPGVADAFLRFHDEVLADGALNRKTKELAAIAAAVAVGCDSCIAWHVTGATSAGATKEQVSETAAVGMIVAAGQGLGHVQHAIMSERNSTYDNESQS